MAHTTRLVYLDITVSDCSKKEKKKRAESVVLVAAHNKT
jgi:hypothetical protein